MSGLWTPSGEHGPDDDPGAGPGTGPGGEPAWTDDDALSPEEEAAAAEEMRRVRQEIAGTPASDIVANHAIGLWQLAVLHLSPGEGEPLRLDEAAVAIDAMGGIVDTLGDRLGDHAAPLRDAVSQLRLAFVDVQRRIAEG